MSILAEPRRKQKISVDPQNLTWKNDEQKFSKKLMEKMGWSQGDGLGRNRQGNADCVKLKANYSGKGLGADKMNDYDSTWISHHDDFADLLEALNKNKEAEPEQTEEEKSAAAEKVSIELKSKSLRRRIHYQKFTRAKDTSNYSDSHKKGILGFGRLKKDKGEEEKKEEEEKEESSDSQGSGDDKKEGQNTVSTLSVGDYFAAKMAALKAKREAASNELSNKEIKQEEPDEKETGEEQEKRKAEKKERKRLRREQREKERLDAENQQFEIKMEIKEEPDEFDESEKKRLKKEKKRLKRLHEQQQQEAGNDEKCDELPKKRKKLTEEDH